MNPSVVPDSPGVERWAAASAADPTAAQPVRLDYEAALRESEERFRATFENSAMGMALVGLDGRWLRVNDVACRITGYTRDELLSRTFGDITHPDDRAESELQVERLRAGAIPSYTLEKRYVRKDGTAAWVRITVSVVRDLAGAPKLFFGSIEDITARRQAEAALRASEAKFAAAFGQSPLGLTITSIDTGRLIEVNQGLLEVTGYAREEMLGRTPEEVGLWIEPEMRRERFAMLRAGQRPPDIEGRFRIKDGREVVALVASTLIEIDGQPCVLTSVVDITERKRVEHALRASEARQRFLVDLNTATQALSDPDRIMAVTADLLGHYLDADRCAYAEVEPDENHVVITGDYIRGVPSMVGRTQLAMFGETTWRMLREGKTYVTSDSESDPRSPPDPVVYRMMMIRAAIAVPLCKDGRLVAGMAVTQATPRDWRADEIELVELVVNRCWEAIARARALRRLEESEARAQLALDVSGQGTWTWDPRDDTVQADRRCRDICGLPPDRDLTLADILPIIHPEDRTRIEQALRRALAPGGDGTYAEEFRVLAGGGERWVQAKGLARMDAGDHRVVAMLGTVLDISGRKRIEQELKENDRRKDEFLATLAHELRNPLAPLRNVLQVRRLSRGGADALDEMMERQVNHMVRLVDDLLEVTRISQGKIELQRAPVDLVGVLRQVIDTASPQIAEAGVELVRDEPERLIVNADAVRLTQVFTNLLHNALKFTDRGGRVRLRAEVEGHEAVVSIRDTGAGIPPEMLDRVFDLFTQLDRSRSDGGLGIGLSLARKLVLLHGGRIEARSEGLGHGAEFIVRLPAAAAPDLRDPPAPKPAALGLRRILVVDDNRDAADSLGMLLKYLGADVEVAYGGEAALAVLERYRPSLVLLDLGMPGMDGFEVARRLRDRYGPSITLVALTGWGQERDRERTRAAGFDRHLIKPLDASLLTAVLESLDGGARPEGPAGGS